MKKIAVIGPESTGKSKLCEALADHYQTLYVKEYARDYLIAKNNIYTKEDLIHIAKSQLELESKIEKQANQYLFIDNDLINIKIWMQEVFNEEADFINNLIIEHPYDLYLLCDIDIAWEQDLLRTNEHNRAYLYNRFESELIKYQFPFQKIAGIGDIRTFHAIEKIDFFFSEK